MLGRVNLSPMNMKKIQLVERKLQLHAQLTKYVFDRDELSRMGKFADRDTLELRLYLNGLDVLDLDSVSNPIPLHRSVFSHSKQWLP